MMSLSTLEFLAGQAAKAIRRNPLITVAAITNVAVALSVVGAFVLASVNLGRMADEEARAAVITCELSGAVSPAEVDAALLSDPRVKLTRYNTKEENLLQTARRLGYDYNVLKLLPNPLPDTITVYVADPQDIEAVAAQASKIPGVLRASYPKKVTERILAVARGVKIAGTVAGVLLGVAALTVVSTTIRLTIYARRREIRIMQLVGATHWFIRLPFLMEGIFYGLTGGVVAAVFLLMGYSAIEGYVSQNLEFVKLTYNTEFLALFGVGLVLCGVLFGAAGSLTGVSRYLRAV